MEYVNVGKTYVMTLVSEIEVENLEQKWET
jgi:hypothetical protein